VVELFAELQPRGAGPLAIWALLLEYYNTQLFSLFALLVLIYSIRDESKKSVLLMISILASSPAVQSYTRLRSRNPLSILPRLQDVTSFDGGDVDPARRHLHLRIRRREVDFEADQEDSNPRK
jgi:hypothetical protein